MTVRGQASVKVARNMIRKPILLSFFAIALACLSCNTKNVDINNPDAVRKELIGAWEGEKNFPFLFNLRERYEFTASGYKSWATPIKDKWENLPYDEGIYEIGEVRISELSGRKIRPIKMKKKEDGSEFYFMSFVEGDDLIAFEGKDEVVFEKVSSP
jgi:hypothetical protein